MNKKYETIVNQYGYTVFSLITPCVDLGDKILNHSYAYKFIKDDDINKDNEVDIFFTTYVSKENVCKYFLNEHL